jgi:hypothetical protein
MPIDKPEPYSTDTVLYRSDGRHAWMLAGRNPMVDLRDKQGQLSLG